MKTSLDSFTKDNRISVYLHPENDNAKFDYSDGQEVEKKIYRILKKTNDLGIFSRELCDRIMDWSTEYHFSPVRHNLLRHYSFMNTDQILELGCGCGAITRQLGESGAEVTAIEGSLPRALCAAERCRDLDNVKVYCSNFQNISLTPKYDYVTLIGVLEYSSIYFIGDEPFKQCLEIAKSALKKNGKLLIAIENRLGLKYFLGFSEDHTGIVYDGLRDFYNDKTAVTFGKKEITDLLSQNGFIYINFSYPFPDYKMPKAVIFESAFLTDQFSVSDVVSRLNSRDYSYPLKNLPSEYFIWQQLENNTILKDLSNSFLIEASLSDCDCDRSNLARYYTVDRKRGYNTETSFILKGSTIRVIKEKIEESLPALNDTLLHVLIEDGYTKGHSLDFYLNKSIANNNFKAFIEYFEIWLKYILNNGLSQVDNSNIYNSTLKDNFIDSNPKNIIISKGLLILIDTEWRYKKRFTVNTLIIRYLKEIDPAFINNNIPGSKDPIEKMFDSFKIEYSNEIYEQYYNVEADIDNIVYDSCFNLINSNYSNKKLTYNFRHKVQNVLKSIKTFCSVLNRIKG